jgi:hypothetical protein
MNGHETSSQEDDGVDQSNNPLILALTSNAKLLRERQVGAVGTRLIPSLSGGTDGAQGDGVPEHDRAMPLVIPLIDEGIALLLAQL